jgi:hypothetical protein
MTPFPLSAFAIPKIVQSHVFREPKNLSRALLGELRHVWAIVVQDDVAVSVTESKQALFGLNVRIKARVPIQVIRL